MTSTIDEADNTISGELAEALAGSESTTHPERGKH